MLSGMAALQHLSTDSFRLQYVEDSWRATATYYSLVSQDTLFNRERNIYRTYCILEVL